MAKKRTKINLTPPTRPHTGALEELFSTPEDAEQASGMQLLAIRLDAIRGDSEQPRRTFVDSSLRELADSIAQDGVIQPIEVTQDGRDKYIIVHGERRWRAAQLAGLTTIPAVVRRRDYDEVTRFVRQMVENIQREDLNDVDRAAGLMRLKELMQTELDTAVSAGKLKAKPHANSATWAKVGKRMGYSRQRIHQLIQLLRLPDEIKDAVRSGSLSERDTRVYQGLKMGQQRDLYYAQEQGSISPREMRKLAKHLKQSPHDSVSSAMAILQEPAPYSTEGDVPSEDEQSFDKSFTPEAASPKALRHGAGYVEGSSVIPARTGAPTAVDRLDYVRGHLARVQRRGLTAAEQKEVVRLLELIQQDVESLLTAVNQ